MLTEHAFILGEKEPGATVPATRRTRRGGGDSLETLGEAVSPGKGQAGAPFSYHASSFLLTPTSGV